MHSHARSPRLLFLGVLVATAVGLGTAATSGQAPREGTLFVSAVNDHGDPVEGLGPEAFVVREDGVAREILRVSRATEPIDIAVLIDNSTAMSEHLVFLRRALGSFVARMSPGNQMALIGLADRPTILVDYTSDTKALTDRAGGIFSLPQSGMTLLDGIYETSRGLERRETPRAVLVTVTTDGTEFTNRYSKDVVAAARRAGAALHMVTIGRFLYEEQHEIRERSQLLGDGPRDTGGQRISMLTPHGLDGGLERLAKELQSQYKVVYGRPESLIQAERATVASARPGVTMRGAPMRGAAGGSR